MVLNRSGFANLFRGARTVVKSLPAFSVIYFCLLGVFGPSVARAGNAPFPNSPISTQSKLSVADRLAAQNALFKQQYEDDLRSSPESETARGDYRDNAMLDDYSLDASAKQNAVDHAYRVKLE